MMQIISQKVLNDYDQKEEEKNVIVTGSMTTQKRCII